jgi:hypothetical protein
MAFFRLQAPPYESDYEQILVNGSAQARYRLPGVNCSVCGATRGFASPVLPYELPREMADDERLSTAWPISQDDRTSLVHALEESLRRTEPRFERLPLGASFPPIEWRIPSPPGKDFFWAMLQAPIVSARIAAELRAAGYTGFELIPVASVRVGKAGRVIDRESLPNGEPEELLAFATEDPAAESDFYLLSVLAEGRLNSRMTRRETCRGCGDAEVRRAQGWEQWEDGVWNGADIFYFPTTLHITATERVVAHLQRLRASNLRMLPLDGAG